MIEIYKNNLPMMAKYIELNRFTAIGVCQNIDCKYVVACVTHGSCYLPDDSFKPVARGSGRNKAIKKAKELAKMSGLPYVGENWG